MRVFRAIVRPAVGFLLVTDTEFTEGSPVRSQAISHYLLGVTVPLQRFLQEFQRGLLVPTLRHETLENLALVIDGPPKVVLLAMDLHKDLVQMPTPMARSHPLDTPLADLRGKHWPEPMPPKPHRLMADVDAALVQKVLDVSQRQREPDIHHHSQADDFGRGLEVTERGALGHDQRLV